jgi:hypothetical protein
MIRVHPKLAPTFLVVVLLSTAVHAPRDGRENQGRVNGTKPER